MTEECKVTKKPHKHAEFIKAWADGAEIEFRTHNSIEWNRVFKGWSWDSTVICEYRIKPQPKPDVVQFCNLKLTFDGETGQLKSAEVLT